jgi:putative ABC transport system permease protein
VTAGSLSRLRGDTIALGRHRADTAHAHVGDRVAVTLGDGTRTHATVVAIYTRDLAFGDALLAPELALSHQTTPLLGTILVQAARPATVAARLRALAPRYPGLRVRDRASLAAATDADREMNRWFGPQFVAEIFAFTSIAVVTTLIMIALRRRRELALLRLVGATRRQVRAMARWEAALIIWPSCPWRCQPDGRCRPGRSTRSARRSRTAPASVAPQSSSRESCDQIFASAGARLNLSKLL